jgi:hypothetical protein
MKALVLSICAILFSTSFVYADVSRNRPPRHGNNYNRPPQHRPPRPAPRPPAHRPPAHRPPVHRPPVVVRPPVVIPVPVPVPSYPRVYTRDIDCGNYDYRPVSCYTGFNHIQNVHVVQQISGAPCYNYGQANFRVMGSYLEVYNGCRAIFRVTGY